MGEARRREQRLAEEKAALFAKEPDKFFHVSDALLVVLKPDGNDVTGVMNNCVNIDEVKTAWFLTEESCQNRRDQIRVVQAKERHAGIQVVSNMPPLPGSNGGLILQS